MKPHHKLYFIAILPPEPIMSEVEALKQDLAEAYDTKVALKSPAHITLYKPFEWKKTAEATLMNILEAFAERQAPFAVQLSGYDCFAPRTIFVNPVASSALTKVHKDLVQQLDESLGLKRYQNDQHPFRAHMTIANRDISKQDFAQAWGELAHKDYERQFLSKELVLFQHNGKNWDKLAVYPFKKQP